MRKEEERLRVTINIARTHAELLGLLDDAGGGDTQPLEMRVMRVLLQLVDHAQQGVYRNGAWERQWVCQVFGEFWLDRTEPGDPYGRDASLPKQHQELGARFNRRPRAGYYDGVPLYLNEED